MKTIYELLTATLLTVHSLGQAQNITYSSENVPLKTIFFAIQKQTGFGFFYGQNLLSQAKSVNINVKNATLAEVLTITLKDQALAYKIENKTILVFKKKSPENKESTLKTKFPSPKKVEEEAYADLQTIKKSEAE